MVVYIFGAGATRGASFVNPQNNPCLPPLDTDFFTQLQRIRNPQQQELVRQVIKDTVELFGVNFQVTMESVFTTLENTVRMIETTGENRDFKQKELKDKKARLMRAIATVLAESLLTKELFISNECKYHNTLVQQMRDTDNIVSFNYDCLIDNALKTNGDNKWNAHYGYGFKLGKRGSNLSGENDWQPQQIPTNKNTTIHLYKLHGSLHFQIKEEKINLKRFPYPKDSVNPHFTIIPPESNKRYDEGVFKHLWFSAGQALSHATAMVVIGYSLPITDSHANALFRISVKREKLKSLVIVNPDRESRRRIRYVLSRGISSATRVFVFDTLADFAVVPRDLWDTE